MPTQHSKRQGRSRQVPPAGRYHQHCYTSLTCCSISQQQQQQQNQYQAAASTALPLQHCAFQHLRHCSISHSSTASTASETAEQQQHFKTWLVYTQSRGFLAASKSSASGLPGSGTTSYSHRLVRGILIRMDSIRPPVFRPKVVPRSYTRLNSTYLVAHHSSSRAW
jgi:hypothetical protein